MNSSCALHRCRLLDKPSFSAPIGRAPRGVLALTLFMAWVTADHHNVAMAANNLAVIADPLHAWLNLHGSSLSVVLVLLFLFVAVHNTTPVQVVRAKLDYHSVFGKNPNVVLPHLA